jgi:uncharacterized LabA/DUF88 family protein
VSKNVAVFVDVANIFYAAKAAGVDIDYVTLLKSASAGRDLVRAYAYTGLDPDNENQRNFHNFLARHGYRVVSKDIRKYGDGKVKANLDIELVVDMMKTARNLDIAIVVSGDGDFAPAIRAVQEMGVRVEVISFRGNTSSDLMDVADQFTDITQLAKVERGSSRSGRRVAADDDLSMTEVPDKMTEGGPGRGRGRGRGRTRAPEQEPAVATAAVRAAEAAGGVPLVVMPGERLSRVAPGSVDALPAANLIDEAGAAETPGDDARDDGVGEDADGRRRRRRRGGRGRGRGRGQGEGLAEALPEGLAEDPAASTPFDEEEEEEVAVAVTRGPRPTPFGSVWDSQLGTSRPQPPALQPLDDEDLDEPEIPEYLIAERRQRDSRGGAPGGAGGGRGARGGRSAYTAAMDRERFGRGGGGGGINRYPDVSARERGGRSTGPEPVQRSPRPQAPQRSSAGGSTEPWSEVPPELEAMLRAQLAGKPKSSSPSPQPAEATVVPEASGEEATGTSRAAGRGRGRGRGAGTTGAPDDAPEAVKAEATPEATESAPPKRRTTRRAASSTEAAQAPGEAAATDAPEEAAPKRRTTRRAAPKTGDAEAGPAAGSAEAAGEEAPAAPRKRATRRATPEADAEAGAGEDAPAAPKRRTTRRKTDES